MADSPKLPDDEITQRLREAARRKRPWSPISFLLTVLVLGVPVALLVWWFWPRAHPPELMVIAFDDVSKPGKAVTVKAATEPVAGGDRRWGGLDLFFEEMAPQRLQASETFKALTNEQGIAQLQLRLKSTEPVVEIEVRYLDESVTPPWFDRARCRVFTWPPDAKILAVDVEPTLKNADDWPVLAKALAEAQKAGWQLAYLAVNADTVLAYRKTRDWALQQITLEKDQMVNGPVLARQTLFANESEAAARKAVLAGLKAEFSGALLYIASDQGLKLHSVGANGDLVGDPVAVSWPKLIDVLRK
jgi:hypothetical protein